MSEKLSLSLDFAAAAKLSYTIYTTHTHTHTQSRVTCRWSTSSVKLAKLAVLHWYMYIMEHCACGSVAHILTAACACKPRRAAGCTLCVVWRKSSGERIPAAASAGLLLLLLLLAEALPSEARHLRSCSRRPLSLSRDFKKLPVLFSRA